MHEQQQMLHDKVQPLIVVWNGINHGLAFIHSEMHFVMAPTHSPLLDASRDHAIFDLLGGLEDDGFHRTHVRHDSKFQSYHPGAQSYQCSYQSYC